MEKYIEELEQIASNPNNGLYYYAISLTRDENEARDLLQQTYLHGLRSIKKGQYRPINGTLIPWLAVIMRNVYINNYRKKGKNSMSIDDIPDLQAREEHRQVTEEDIGEELARAWYKTPLEQRRILLLRAQGLSCEEVAARVGVSLGTISSRSHRGRRSIIKRYAYEIYPEIVPDTRLTRDIMGPDYFRE